MAKQCLICEKQLEESNLNCPASAIGILYNATIWRSNGNYGSTKFDPVGPNNNEFLELYICDPCLTTKGKFINHVDLHIEKTQTYQEYEQNH